MAQKTDIRLRNLKVYLRKYMEDLEYQVKQRILAPRKRTYPSGKTHVSPIESSGNLRRSVYHYSYEDDDSIHYELEMDSYGVDLNEGELDLPSRSQLREWLRAKKITPRERNGKIMSRKKAANAIRNSIYNYGSPRAPFIDEALSISKITAREGRFITNAVKQDLEDQINDALLEMGYNMSSSGSVSTFKIDK